MRRNELTIGLALAGIAAVVAFWLLAVAPKRHEASDLKDDVDQLQTQLDEAQQTAAAGQQARTSFPVDYHNLVVLGKAVPADGDQASLLVQLQRLANRSGVGFQSIDLADATSSASATSSSPPPASSGSTESASPTSSTSSTSSESSSSSPPADSGASTAEPAQATEATAATLPIGAAIGPAGLPVMRYKLTFSGGFFQIADFMKRLNRLVRPGHGTVDVSGRLVTVDAFTLAPAAAESQGLSLEPTLTAALSVTTYLTPADQGLTAGAAPSGPAPSSPAPDGTTATPTAGATASTSTPTPTSSTPTPTTSP